MKSFRLNYYVKDEVKNAILNKFDNDEDSLQNSMDRARIYIQGIIGQILSEHFTGQELVTLTKFGHIQGVTIKIGKGSLGAKPYYGVTGRFHTNFPTDASIAMSSFVYLSKLMVPSCIKDVEDKTEFTGPKPVIQQIMEKCNQQEIMEHFLSICMATEERNKFIASVKQAVDGCRTSKQLLELFPSLEDIVQHFAKKEQQTPKKPKSLDISNINAIITEK